MLRVAAALTMLLVAGAAHAQLYWRTDVGYSETVNAGICEPGCASGARLDDVGQSVVLSAGLGWRFSRSLRADLEFGYRGSYELQEGENIRADLTSMSLMLGVYWDFPAAWGTPYLGAGVGAASNKIDPIANTDGALGTAAFLPGGTSTGAAWSLMVGMWIVLSPRVSLDIGYRFIDLGKIESDPGGVTCAPVACPSATSPGMTGRLRAHELMAGLRF